MSEVTENIPDEELVELFDMANSYEEKLRVFSKIQDDKCRLELLESVPEKEKYRFIGLLNNPVNIVSALNLLRDETIKSKTFNFVSKKFKGNNMAILEILRHIDFKVTLSSNMLNFNLNNLNSLNMDFLMNIQKHVENYTDMKFKINERASDSRNIIYTFNEILAIVAKLEELTADIPEEMDEANKFYTIYSRITRMMTYNYNYLKKHDEAKAKLKGGIYSRNSYNNAMRDLRRKPAGLYGGLVEGKSICAGYALILHEALKYVGIKSQYVTGWNPGEKDGHAWTQVQIDGKWYNTDPTWDSERFQIFRKFEYMLLNDEEFDESHSEFSRVRTKTYHKCTCKFDYSKIKGLSPNQIMALGKDTNRI